MLHSEKLAIAAHVHVVLRRLTGRVTDTEWMAANAEYATEIVRFARAAAHEKGHADLAQWADKLEAAMPPATPARTPVRDRWTGSAAASSTGTPSRPAPLTAPSEPPDTGTNDTHRYVRGIR